MNMDESGNLIEPLIPFYVVIGEQTEIPIDFDDYRNDDDKVHMVKGMTFKSKADLIHSVLLFYN